MARNKEKAPRRLPNRSPRYTAGNTYVLSFQAEGVCIALRELIDSGCQPGLATRALLRGVRDNLVADSSGDAIAYIPEVTDDMPLPDLLVIAETIRATVLAFLTPDESETRGKFGFDTSSSA